MASSTAGRDKVALTGWFSFTDGEVTAGDLLSLDAVRAALDAAGIPYEVFWSPVFHPAGPALADLPRPAPHSRMVFVCGPVHGEQVEDLHSAFAASARYAVGVSVVDPRSPAVTGFHRVLARDTPDAEGVAADLSFEAPPARRPPPVAGVVLTGGQGEYGPRRRHDEVTHAVLDRLRGMDAALVRLDTRTSTAEWDLPSTAEQYEAVLRRMDVVVTNRLHGLVLALRCGIPVLAVDPVDRRAKLSAQGRALSWPAVLTPDEVGTPAFDRWWSWCLTEGRDLARARRDAAAGGGRGALTADLLDLLAQPVPLAG
ncbi:polysaccharide pyruvyl transferase family protein [Actinacidiphila paucisporea]|uniref:Polysaccharide pyruvyl transferase n=1 Tax=Actinacidiphila paucisporea TaxID=310782 RepID=A0A1M7I8B9_9ACTN|nr:polysaccharide pyruvyl transferase family protein [Actinacidiphila paucisporea]SHM36984.1 Polysaccharide pyruvyl transferase [Actinacidiphila paucisporea]